jgi:type I restriction enzyme S subunit
MYDRVADAPDAVGKLRKFVLDLAVRGKLVEQSANEVAVAGSSSNKADKPVNHATEVAHVAPFPIPREWSFTTVGRVLEMVNGRAFKPTEWLEHGLPIIRIQNLNNPLAPFNHCDPLTVDARHRVRDGDLLISWSGTPGTSFGAFIWARGDAALNQHIFRCVLNGEDFSKEFLRLGINSQLAVLIGQAQGGVGLQHVTKGTLQSLLLPLPPLAEQHRIVAKVDELMALCDQLESARAEREAARDRLAAASLTRLNAPDPTKFRSDALFALNVLPALSARADQVRQLRQTILNLAVRVGLSERHGWNAEPMPLENFASLQNGYAFKSEWFDKSGVPLLRNVNVSHGVLDWTQKVCLAADRAAEYARFRLKEGDVVLSLDRPFITTGTKAARVCADDLPALLLQRVGRFEMSQSLSPAYLYLWVRSPHFSEQVNPGRSNGVPHISSKQVEKALILVPSLKEQQRIVAKVDELLSYCDELEAALTNSESVCARLLHALLHEAIFSSVVAVR